MNKKAKSVLSVSLIVFSILMLFSFVTYFTVSATPTYSNDTDGFNIGVAGVDESRGITTNGSDFWVVDGFTGDDFVYHFNSTGDNQTDGFSISAAGAEFVFGITTNGSDFWVVDLNDDFVYHFNSTGDNQTDGFSISAAGSGSPTGITTNGSDFWIVDTGDDFVYHFNSTGDNQTDGFDIGGAGSGSPTGITINDSDFWIVDTSDVFIYHFNSTGDNQTDGFSILASGTNGAQGITTNDTDFWVVDFNNEFVYHFFPEPVVITVVFPLNQTHDTTTILFNITAVANNGMDGCLYSLTSGTLNYTMTNDTATQFNATNSSMTLGKHTVTFYCNDTSNNIQTDTQQFFIGDLLISSCEILDAKGGNYTLNESLTTTGDCLIVSNNDITIDFKGYNITGDNGVSDSGVSVSGYNNITIKNGSIYDFGTGISLVNNKDNDVTNMTINSNSQNGISLSSSSNNKIQDNTLNSNSQNGISLSSSSSNTITNNNIWNCSTGGTYSCIYVANADRNIFDRNKINQSDNYGVFIDVTSCASTSSHNVFKNTNMTNIDKTDIFSKVTIFCGPILPEALNNTFLNFTYNSESVGGASQLIRKWHFDLTVYVNKTDSNHKPENANVILYNSTDDGIFSNTTGTSGYVTISEELKEYTNNGGTKIYATNYSINVTHEFYYENSSFYNVTSEIDENLTMFLEPLPQPGGPGDSGAGPTFVEVEKVIEVFVFENRTFCGDNICQMEGNDFGIKETFFSCQIDCPGAIGENFDELIYLFTRNCWDRNPSTVCFFTQQLFAVLPGRGLPEAAENMTIYKEGQVCLEEICERVSGKTLISNCFDEDSTSPCFWNTNMAFRVLLLGGVGLLAISFVRVEAPGRVKKVNPYIYLKLKYRGRKWGRR